jgi:hypothetical protein
MFFLTPNSAITNVTSTITTVANATYVLLTNFSGREAKIDLWSASQANLKGSMYLVSNTPMILIKGPGEYINASPTVSATSVKVRM